MDETKHPPGGKHHPPQGRPQDPEPQGHGAHDHGAHDHGHCITAALTAAEAVCAQNGARLTPLRRRVLELVWSDHRPRGAYALLEALEVGEAKKVAPLTVYRALDFLVEQGLVHRIESLNAYLGCCAPGTGHAGQFLVCERCGTAEEVVDSRIDSAIAAVTADLGFAIHRKTIEISGVCHTCRLTKTEEP